MSQKQNASQENRKNALIERPLLIDRMVRIFLAIFFGLIAGLVVFFFPTQPFAAPVSTATPTLTPTFTSTPTPISTPSERLRMLVSMGTPTLEQPPDSTPTPTIITEVTCSSVQPVGAAIGQIAMVRLDPSIPNQVREQPDIQSAVLGRMQTGEFFIILDGPQCADDYIWWKVQSARGLLGWIAEGYTSSYWLVTPTSVSAKLIDTPTSSLSLAKGLVSPTPVSAAQLFRILKSDNTAVLMSVDWSPDGTRLASGDGEGGGGGVALQGLDYDNLQIWDWAQGERLSVTTIGEKQISNVDWSLDGTSILLGEAMEVRNGLNGELLVKMDTSGVNCRNAKWSPNGLLVAGGCYDGSVFIWDASTGIQLRRLHDNEDIVTDIAWSPSGQQIATSSFNGILHIWDVISGKQMNSLANIREKTECYDVYPCGNDRITSIAWSPDGKEIAFGDATLEIKIWNPTSGQLRSIGYHRHNSSTSIYDIAWSPDGKRLASTNGGYIQVWGLAEGLFTYKLDPGDISVTLGVAWSPDGKYLAVAGSSRSEPHKGLIWIWSIPGTPTVTPTQTATSQPTLTVTPSFTPTMQLPTATPTFVSEPTYTSTIVPAITETPRSNKPRVNLSPELYLDENSSPDNLGESNHPDYSYFHYDKDLVWGYIYHFENEEWVIAESMTCIFPSNDVNCDSPVEGKLRAYYVQLWKDRKPIYSLNVNYGNQPHTFLRYEDHWIFSFGDDWNNQGWIVQDGTILNDLYDYDTTFSLFLLDGKPFFFFRRGDQFGISFHGEEIMLPYSNIQYSAVCCESGGSRNPRASDTKVGFYAKIGDADYQYIEIGLR